MTKATDTEIKQFTTYRAYHIALVQRLGKLVFDEDFSSHDNDKIETDEETLNKWALYNTYNLKDYKSNTTEYTSSLEHLAANHVCSQKHHPEFWDINITPVNYIEAEHIKATRMSKKAIKEMCCDWSAIALYKNQPIFEYFNKICTGANPRFLFTSNQKDFIIECLSKIEKTIKNEHITWIGKDYTAKQIKPLKESYSNDDKGKVSECTFKLLKPSDNDVLKDVKLKEFKDSTISQLLESIIDVPQKEYCNGVLTSKDKMTPGLRRQIIETIYNWKKQINFDFDVYKIIAKGSLLTKRYNDTTDLDITVYTSLSKEQLEQVYNIIPKGNKILINGKESSHILDIYVYTEGEKTEEQDVDNIYDVAHDKWLKRSEEYSSEIPLNYALEVANFFINGCTISLSNYNNDKILYQYYKSLDPQKQEITQKEKDKALSEVKTNLQTDLDGLRLALHMVSAFRHEAYGENANPFSLSINIISDNPHNSLNEVMVKLIEKFGIKDELRKKAEECAKLLELE